MLESACCRIGFRPLSQWRLLWTSPCTYSWVSDRFLTTSALRSTCSLLTLLDYVVFSAFWFFGCSDFGVWTQTTLPIFDSPTTSLYLARLWSLACYSPICLLIVLKWWSRSGFVKLSVIFTFVSTFQTSSFLSVRSSHIWWHRISICFILAWYTRFVAGGLHVVSHNTELSTG